MTVQKLRQSYNNALVPSEDNEAYYMFVKEHEGIVSLLREQLELKDKVIEDKDRFIDSLLTLIPKYHSGGYTGEGSKCQPHNPPKGR